MIVLKKYEETQSITLTLRALGYPGRETLYKWIRKKSEPTKPKSIFRGVNTPEHPRHPSIELKLEVLHRCFELGEDIKSVSDEIGYSRASIYVWRRKYLQRGAIALMNPADDPRGELTEGITSSSKEIDAMKAKIQDMQMQIDILTATIDVIKKDPGVDQTSLRNQEKAVIIGALKGKYSLPKLLSTLNYPRSSYYYQLATSCKGDKYQTVREHIKETFADNHGRYGYRRINAVLNNEGLRLSEKVIRRIMKQEGLLVFVRKARKYHSYKGEITPAVPNILERNFHSYKPNHKWVTDITEFAIPAGKVYLSPMIDCFDGMPVCWRISTTPDANLVNTMLDDAISTLREGEYPIVHSDRGCHYRWPGWITRMDQAHLTRSMSRKGCSPDNSACEGFFGRMKNEVFFGVSWTGVSLDAFIQTLNNYMEWYCKKRIKLSLGGMSPMEYRKSLGLVA
jgi:transposase InsO family protein/transposase-like protein